MLREDDSDDNTPVSYQGDNMKAKIVTQENYQKGKGKFKYAWVGWFIYPMMSVTDWSNLWSSLTSGWTRRMASQCSRRASWRMARRSSSRDRIRTQELMVVGIVWGILPMSLATTRKLNSRSSTFQSECKGFSIHQSIGILMSSSLTSSVWMPTKTIFPTWPRSSPLSNPFECRNRHPVRCSSRTRSWSLFGLLPPNSRVEIRLEVIRMEILDQLSCWTPIHLDRTRMAILDLLWATTICHRPMTTCLREMLLCQHEQSPRDMMTSCLPLRHRLRWSNLLPFFGIRNLRCGCKVR